MNISSLKVLTTQDKVEGPFKNNNSIELKNRVYESEFRAHFDKSIMYLGKLFALLLLIYSLYDFFYQHFNYTNAKSKGVKWINLSYICSICVLSTSLILFLLNIILKNIKILKYACFCIYILFTFPSLHVRQLPFVIEDLNKNSYSFICIFEFIIRSMMAIYLLISIHEVYYLNFIVIILNCAYYPFIDNTNDILFSIIIL